MFLSVKSMTVERRLFQACAVELNVTLSKLMCDGTEKLCWFGGEILKIQRNADLTHTRFNIRFVATGNYVKWEFLCMLENIWCVSVTSLVLH